MICEKELAHIYAKSIFKIALKNNNTNRVKKILFLISYIIYHKKIKSFFSQYSDPIISYKIFKSLLYDLKMYNYEKNFLKILIENKRLFLLNKIYIAYNSIKNKYNKKIFIVIQSSHIMNNIQKNKIKCFLKKKIFSNIKFNFIVDQNLIGGFRILINNFLIDLSIKNNLTYLKNFLQT
jgi:F-type H+-transporting ATPase subunit delta